ncbi:hypothetical protein B5S31_g5465 [[Candida] boidinii]|nr:hypothetical protein B5S31_g5465 [[Candida] boidinii]OWB81155.1 hypothetical protein B5S32_g5518 [[Candida] boidinii]
MTFSSNLINIGFIGIITYFLIISPYTKVEESFNIQAIHDLIKYDFEEIDKFDHITFPGVVKRSFIGSLLISTLTKILLPISKNKLFSLVISYEDSEILDITQLNLQILSRFILGLLNGLALIALKNSVINACNKRSRTIGFWYGLLQLSQFHIFYYSSRTLPNFIALPFVNFALSKFIIGDLEICFLILSFTGIIFRIEILIFTGILFLISYCNKQIKFINGLKYLIIGGIIGLISTFFIDSFFWKVEWTIPELESFYYNVIEGKSSNWGTEPWYYYLTFYLPKLFLKNPVVLLTILPGFFFDFVNFRVGTIKSISISSILFVLIMSLQPHKEWRFIIYAIPGLTLSSANTTVKIIGELRNIKFLQKIFKIIVILVCLFNILLSLFMGYIFSFNYPGGEAINKLNLRLNLIDKEFNPLLMTQYQGNEIKVHMDVYSCMTGITLFNEIDEEFLQNIKIIYDKTEDINKLNDNDLEGWDSFDFIITDFDNDENKNENYYHEKLKKLPDPVGCQWVKINVSKIYSGFQYKPIIMLLKNLMNNPESIGGLIYDLIINRTKSFIFRFFKSAIVLTPKVYTYEKVCPQDTLF